MIWHSRLWKPLTSFVPSFPEDCRAEAKLEHIDLVIINEMVGLAFAVTIKPLVFEHAVEQRAARTHPVRLPDPL